MMKFDSLKKQFPVANARVAQQQQASRAMDLQDAAGQMARGEKIPGGTGALAASGIQQAGQQAAASQAQEFQQQQAIGSLERNERRMGAAEAAGDRNRGLQQTQLAGEQQLAALDLGAKKELFDDQMVFQKGKAGQTLFNTRQLADLAVLKARDSNDLRKFEQEMSQMTERKMKMYDIAMKKIEQELGQSSGNRERIQNQAHLKELAQAKAALEKKMAKDKAKADNTRSIIKGVFTVGGAVVGGIVGGPVGAVAGASVAGAGGDIVSNAAAGSTV